MSVILLQMRGQGVSVKDVNQHEFVKAFAAFLKKLVIISYFLIVIKIHQLRREVDQLYAWDSDTCQ